MTVYIPFDIEDCVELVEDKHSNPFGKLKVFSGLAHCYNLETHEFQKVHLFVRGDQPIYTPQKSFYDLTVDEVKKIFEEVDK